METLVMLMLVSMAATMMFQMLDSYRIAQQRIAAQAGNQDRGSLFEAWLIEGVRGLRDIPGTPFIGSRLGLEGVTLNPLFGPLGAPTAFAWKLRSTPEGGEIEYSEDGAVRWTLPLREFDAARFVYFTADGRKHDQWPPALGLQEGLPAQIGLVRGTGRYQRVRVASVLGPLLARDEPFELEQD
ncbi:MAG: hypothetical protein ACR2J7_00215 [Luteimonas sp.]